MEWLRNAWKFIYPPAPAYTEEHMPDLTGKVIIVTGANSGIGKSLASILYAKNAKVYVAARSEERAHEAIESIKAEHKAAHSSDARGELVYLHLDLADLSTIKASVETFLEREDKLHLLFNNAGLASPPQGSKTVQGYELQLGTNNIGPFLFTKLLTPVLTATASKSLPDTVRVVWVSSWSVSLSPTGGLDLKVLERHGEWDSGQMYIVTKVCNYFHAVEYARRYGAASNGVVSIAVNPGNLTTGIFRHMNFVQRYIIERPLAYPPIYGAYAILYAGLSEEVTAERVKTENWVIPWGYFGPIREDIDKAARPKAEGGGGVAEVFWEWTEEQVKPYL